MIRQKSVRLGVEVLECRDMLAGIIPLPQAIPPALVPLAITATSASPFVDFSSRPVKVSSGMLPGSIDQPLGIYQINPSGRTTDHFDGLNLVSVGDGSLTENVRELDLWGDLNRIGFDGPRKDGFETLLGRRVISYSDYYAPSLYLPVSTRSVWVTGGLPLRVTLLANLNSYLYGDALGVAVAEANFSTIRGVPVDVLFTGSPPALQSLKSHSADIYQYQMPNAYGIVSPGKTSVPVFQFGAYSSVATQDTLVFAASLGNLNVAQNYQLVHADYRGEQDMSAITGKVVGNKLTFTFPVSLYQGGTWQVVADIKPANKLPANMSKLFQLSLLSTSSSALDVSSRKLMQGVIVNGVGVGQMHVWAYQSYATAYEISMTSPAVTASANVDMPPNQSYGGNQIITAAKYDIFANGSSQTVTKVQVAAPSYISLTVYYALLYDGPIVVGLAFYNLVNSQFVFTGMNIQINANSTKVLTLKLGLGSPPIDGLSFKATLISLGSVDDNGVASTQSVSVASNSIFIAGQSIYG